MDREKVIEGIEAIREFFGFGLPSQSPVFEAYQRILTDAFSMLKEQEAVVRCKDCAYRGEINCPQYYRQTELSDDYFCADGERR